MLSVGVDAHKATSQITVLGTGGKIVSRAKIPSTSFAFQNALSGYDEPLTAVLEAIYCWGPIYNWLSEVTEEVVLAILQKCVPLRSADWAADHHVPG